MKLQSVQNIQQPKNAICTKVRNVLTKYKLKLKTLAYDIFERHGYYKDKKDGKWKRERDLPSFVTSPSDAKDLIFGKYIFSQEDKKIMENMTPGEQIRYISKLIDENRVGVEWPE